MIEAPRAAGEKISVSTSSAQSGVLDYTRDVVFSCTVDSYVLFGGNPTATDSCLLVPAGSIVGFTNLAPSDKVAVLGTGSGVATIVQVG